MSITFTRTAPRIESASMRTGVIRVTPAEWTATRDGKAIATITADRWIVHPVTFTYLTAPQPTLRAAKAWVLRNFGP